MTRPKSLRLGVVDVYEYITEVESYSYAFEAAVNEISIKTGYEEHYKDLFICIIIDLDD